MASEHVEATLVDDEAAAKQPDLVDAPEDAPAHEGSVMEKPSSKAEAKAKPNYDELSISEDDHVPPTSLKKPAAKATKRLVDNFKFEEDEQHDSLCTGRVELDSLAGESFAKVFDAMKATSQSLSRSQSELESACVWLEIDGKPLTRQSLQNFLTMQKNVALSCQEKIAGFTACLKSRSM
ncbi:unnamed protein product [Effrenium voratum]|nr:unnamed protein product [Effrenium voratum]CAJ1452203.1 unnamed protein product [Effrenium voratum]CAJ1457151.1 unnamed protein product [Effrenium voratum]